MEYLVETDRHIDPSEIQRKIAAGQICVLTVKGEPIGLLRYSLFWDKIPFLNLIYFEKEYRGRGYGSRAMLWWESRMQEEGHPMVLLSTQSDEGAQHFYRKLGYRDTGCLIIDIEPYAQPLELIMIKKLT